MNTSGFYKWDDNNKEWMCGPNIVGGLKDENGNIFNLVKELKDTYIYPIQGWTWYDEEPPIPKITIINS